MRLLSFAAVIAGIFSLVIGDINIHNPRGSNNRQDGNGVNRNNAQRLFDSQNNARGGHNVGSFPGKMYYYAGSTLEIQWAHQHTCGDQNNHCNVVIQYMCDEKLRDGLTRTTPPVQCDYDCDSDEKYGRHESLTYYEQCASRQRNKGLFTANRGDNMGESAQHTRQNNKGKRYGYECPEEKDYYPYWGPTPWKDIAVFESNKTRCELYQRESQNVKSRWACSLSDEYWDVVRGRLLNDNEKVSRVFLFNDRESCENETFTLEGVQYTAEWREYSSHGIEAPECLDEPWSRDNHQGMTIGGYFSTYNWKIPDINAANCTIRVRYNISTGDFETWDTDHTKNSDDGLSNMGPEEIYSSYTFKLEDKPRSTQEREAFFRRYHLRDNPQLDVFDLRKRTKKFLTRIALSTSQYGRTFQDRTHSFAIKRRPESLDGAVIHNLNVKGRRGNIVETFPSTMYDFVPNKLEAKLGDYVHIQWTGSDNNPSLYGQGLRRTDRNNIVQLALRKFGENTTRLSLATSYPRGVEDNVLWGEPLHRMRELAYGGWCKPGDTLDNAYAYFDMGPLQMTKRGNYYYFSTRNNAFSNLTQKGSIIVT